MDNIDDKKFDIDISEIFYHFYGEDMDLTIRKFSMNDLDSMHELLSDEDVMRYIEPVFTREKTKGFLTSAGLSEKPLIYAVDNNGDFVGYVIYHPFDNDSIEIGWVLQKRFWGKGYAQKLTEMLIDKAFELKKDVIIECSTEQEATKHIAQKYGFLLTESVDGLYVYKLKCPKAV